MDGTASAPVGILGAMPEEIALLRETVVQSDRCQIGMFEFVSGTLDGVSIVYASSNVGQIFAASVTTLLIERFKCRAVLFTGVAGALRPHLGLGDLIIADSVVNYDMNCTSFVLPHDPDYRHKRGEYPFLALREFRADERLLRLATQAAARWHGAVVQASELGEDAQPAAAGDGTSLRVFVGLLATGSEFLTMERKHELRAVWDELGGPLAVEMECVAVAQVCHALGVPHLSLRAVSDTLHGDANVDFAAFCARAARNIMPILRAVLVAV